MAWANPSSRLHKARLQMNDVTNLQPSRDSCLLWERIYLTQKWYWPMKPFRRVRPGRVLPASQIDQDTGRQVEKALERQPLRLIWLMNPKPFSRLDFRCQRGLPLTFNYDRILKLWKLACLCHCNFFTPLESPTIYGGHDIDKILIPYTKGGVKAPSFLTGFTPRSLKNWGRAKNS